MTAGLPSDHDAAADEKGEAMTESRVLDVALDTHWAMTESGLRTLLSVVDGWLGSDVVLELPDGDAAGLQEPYDPEAVSTLTGERIEGASFARARNGVGIVPVVGPIFRRGNLMTQVSGATSIELLARDLRATVESEKVDAILLDVDSPGGEVNGISEMSDLIFEARGRKPIRAFVSGSGASGGYWLASAADEVVAADTALLGSIGVRTAFVDESERNRERGVQTIEFVSSQSPRKAPDPTGEEGRAQIQRVIDALADVFIDDVARNRAVNREAVTERFGAGAVFVGEEAVERGLADRLSTFEAEIEDLKRHRATGGLMRPAATSDLEATMSDKTEPVDALRELDPTADQLREACPEAVEAIASEAQLAGQTEGAEAERERIRAIYELDVPEAHGELIEDGMFDPDATADSVSRRILARQAEMRQAQLEARQGDEEDLDAPRERAGSGNEDTAADEANAIIAAARKAGHLQPVAATEA